MPMQIADRSLRKKKPLTGRTTITTTAISRITTTTTTALPTSASSFVTTAVESTIQ